MHGSNRLTIQHGYSTWNHVHIGQILNVIFLTLSDTFKYLNGGKKYVQDKKEQYKIVEGAYHFKGKPFFITRVKLCSAVLYFTCNIDCILLKTFKVHRAKNSLEQKGKKGKFKSNILVMIMLHKTRNIWLGNHIMVIQNTNVFTALCSELQLVK